jgi:exonuclease III
VSTYNVHTLYEICRFDDICKAARKYKINFLAVQGNRYQTTYEIDYINNKSFPYFFVFISANKKNKNRVDGVGGVGGVGRVGRVGLEDAQARRASSLILLQNYIFIGLLISNKYKTCINSYTKVPDRTLAVNINSTPPITIIAIYALVESTKKKVKEKFFDQLEEYIKKLKYSVTIIAGDFNAQIGKDSMSTNNKTIGKTFT